MHVRYAYCYVLLHSLYNIKTSNVFDINRSPRSQLRSPGRSNSTYLYTFSTVLFELSGSLSMPVISSAHCYYKPNSFLKNLLT